MKPTPAIDAIEKIQTILKGFFPEIKVDGDIGKRTMSAMVDLDAMGDKEALADAVIPENVVKASSFADPQDVFAFQKCKSAGNSDNFCFARGDNGIGKWGHNTAQVDTPMVALPREVWQSAGKTGGAGVLVEYNGKKVKAILGDTMPSLANITNGAGMDMNPATCKALDLTPPVMVNGVRWSWI